MTDEIDRLQEYVASLAPASPEALHAARNHLDEAISIEMGVGAGASERTPGNVGVASASRRGRKLVLVLSLAALLAVAVVLPIVTNHRPGAGRPTAGEHSPSKILVKLVADDVNVTVASGSYDMTYTDTTSPASTCVQPVGGSNQVVGGQSSQSGQSGQSGQSSQSGQSGQSVPGRCQGNPFSVITGHGTVDTNPYAMMTVGQVGALGTISLYDNGTDVWEVGGGDYGLAGPGRAGPGAALSGYASSVEGTLGQQAGALDMQGLASGTGYLDLEATEIQGAEPAGTGAVNGVPVTIYKLSMSGLQDPDLTGLTTEQIATIRAADAIIEQSGFSGKTTWVSVDADGYIREVRSVYTLSDGSTVSQDTVLSNFGCAGTVLMPGQAGSPAPPSGCVSPDTAGAGATTSPPTAPVTPPSSPSTTSPSSPTAPA
jgi:hypothetical protein